MKNVGKSIYDYETRISKQAELEDDLVTDYLTDIPISELCRRYKLKKKKVLLILKLHLNVVSEN